MSGYDDARDGGKRSSLEAGQSFGSGRFTLVRKLGRGGMGVVWLALDQELTQEVALKFLPPEVTADEIAIRDLRDECRKSRLLSHPHILRIHDLHTVPDEPAFISMEYVDGPNLTTLRALQPTPCFTWLFLSPLVMELCEALEYAHRKKVVHRDLKPANLMLDAKEGLKLADFGIAATMSDSMSRVSADHKTSGTLVYMSPQQMLGKRPQPTDDIYALGATLYEMLTSRPPFYQGNIEYQVQYSALTPLPERLVELGLENEIPKSINDLILSCLAKDPAERPQSAGAVMEQLELAATERAGSSAFGKQTKKLIAVGSLITAAIIGLAIYRLRPHTPKTGTIAGPQAGVPLIAQNSGTTQPTAVQTSTNSVSPSRKSASDGDSSPLTLQRPRDESWTFTTFAGLAGSLGSADGMGSEARFDGPNGIVVDKRGNLYVAEWENQTIRMINPSGAVSTLAGKAGIPGSADGMGANARFSNPRRLAVDLAGNIYVNDRGNATIRKITPSGMVTTLAGRAGSLGNLDGPAALARFRDLAGIAASPDGSIFVADGGNESIREITVRGMVGTMADQAGIRQHVSGDCDLAIGPEGVVYVADWGNHAIRAFNSTGEASIAAGQMGSPGSVDGLANTARFSFPHGIAFDADHNLYVADWGNDTIRKITSAGVVTTIGGLAGARGSRDGVGRNARFDHPIDVAVDAQGNLYITEQGNPAIIRKGQRQQVKGKE